jgi:hypothetical protein
MMAGADFIKTSTGKETVNATLPVSLTMIRAIRDYQARTGFKVGYKPAGGISKAKDALVYLALMKDELGHAWLQPDLFRFRRLEPAGRHRAAAGALPDRAVFGRIPARDGLSARGRCPRRLRRPPRGIFAKRKRTRA